MPKLDIVLVPDPVLRKKAKAIEQVDDDIRSLMDSMLETMYDAPGIGLAANQIGLTKRVLVMDCSYKDDQPEPFCMANPEIIWSSEALSKYEEGCLSIPEQFAEVARPESVVVRYLDRNGERQELEADGILATCVQHEIDHLNGVLFIDHISALKRNMLLRKLAKWKKEHLKANV